MILKWDKKTLGKQANDLGFVRNIFEKICGLTDVLNFFDNDSLFGADTGA